MIVKDIATVRTRLAVNASFEYSDIEPYLRAAERDFLKPIIGAEQIAAFSETISEAETEQTTVKELVEELLCNYAYYLYVPIGAVQVSGAGILVANTEDSRAANNAEKNDLMRRLKSMAHRCLDEAIETMELSADKFLPFFDSEQYKKYSSLLVNKTSLFNEIYNIENSFQTFLSLRADIKKAEDQYLKSALQKPLLEALKTAQTLKIRKEVKDYAQRALVFFTIANVLDSGAFRYNGNSLVIRFDVLPHEKLVPVKEEYVLQAERIALSDASNYLKEAMELIKSNESDFEEYVPPTEDNTKVKMIHKSGGIVSI